MEYYKLKHTGMHHHGRDIYYSELTNGKIYGEKYQTRAGMNVAYLVICDPHQWERIKAPRQSLKSIRRDE